MNLKEIQNLIKFVAKSGASEVKLEIEDVKITIRTGGSNKTQFQQMTLPVSVPQAPLPQAATGAETIVDAEPVAEAPAQQQVEEAGRVESPETLAPTERP